MVKPSKQTRYKAAFAAILATGVVVMQAPSASAAVPGKCVKVDKDGQHVWKCRYRDTSRSTRAFSWGSLSVRNNTKVFVGVSAAMPQQPPAEQAKVTVESVTPIYGYVEKVIPYTVEKNMTEKTYSVDRVLSVQNDESGRPTITVQLKAEDGSLKTVTGDAFFDGQAYTFGASLAREDPYIIQVHTPDGLYEFTALIWISTPYGEVPEFNGATLVGIGDLRGPDVKEIVPAGTKTVTYKDGYEVTIPSDQAPEVRTKTFTVDTGKVRVTYSDGTTAVVPAPGPEIGSVRA